METTEELVKSAIVGLLVYLLASVSQGQSVRTVAVFDHGYDMRFSDTKSTVDGGTYNASLATNSFTYKDAQVPVTSDFAGANGIAITVGGASNRTVTIDGLAVLNNIVAGADISITVAGANYTIANTSTLQTVTGRGAVSSNAISLTAAGTALSITNNATVGGTLGVTGAVTGGAGSTLADLAVTGNATVGGTLGVTGASTLSGAVSATAAGTGLAVTNNATVGGTLGVTGASTFTGATNHSGVINADATGTGLAVDNNATIGGTLTVTGASTFTGATNHSGVINADAVGTGLAVDNNATVGGTLTVTGNSTLGVLSAGASTLASASVTDDVTVSGGDIRMNHGTQNTITTNNVGVAVPGTGSAGVRFNMYPFGGVGSSMGVSDYALGIEGGTMWFNSAGMFKWYADSVRLGTLDETNGLILYNKSMGYSARHMVESIGDYTTHVDTGSYYITTNGGSDSVHRVSHNNAAYYAHSETEGRGSFGKTGGTTAAAAPQLNVTNLTAANTVLYVQGAAAQAGDLQEWTDSAGTELGRVESNGVAKFAGYKSGTGSAGVAASVIIPAADGIIHDMTFENGLLTLYQTY